LNTTGERGDKGNVLLVSDFRPIDGCAALEQPGVIAVCQICASKYQKILGRLRKITAWHLA
jgi:hypothetical protein